MRSFTVSGPVSGPHTSEKTAQIKQNFNHNRIYQDQSEQHLVLRDGNDDQDGVEYVGYVERGATIIGAEVATGLRALYGETGLP
jgi:hypothetical protein